MASKNITLMKYQTFHFHQTSCLVFLRETGEKVTEFEAFNETESLETIKIFRFENKKNPTEPLEIRIDHTQKEFLVRYSKLEKMDSKWMPVNVNINPVLLFNEFLRS